MKTFLTILSLCAMARAAMSGESALTTTYQPLAGLGGGGVKVVAVTCHHWYANSASSAVDLIHRRNVPPSDMPELATADLNLASVCGLKFATNDLGAIGSEPKIIMDATKFDVAKAGGLSRETIVRASLECLRRCLPPALKATRVTLKCAAKDEKWLSAIVAEFDAAPRDKPFYESE